MVALAKEKSPGLASGPLPFFSPLRPAHHELGIPLSAIGTAQQPLPIDDSHPGAMLCDLGGNVGLGSVIAALAPHDEPDMRGERLPEC
jgi:hypothetical protein